jgi:transposase InsO family protein
MWLRLRGKGHDVARCTVERLMREMGIEGVTRRDRRGRIQPAVATPLLGAVAMGVGPRQRKVREYRGQMASPGRPTVAWREDRVRFWAAIARGLRSEDAAVEIGVSPAVGTRVASIDVVFDLRR